MFVIYYIENYKTPSKIQPITLSAPEVAITAYTENLHTSFNFLPTSPQNELPALSKPRHGKGNKHKDTKCPA